MKVKFYLKEPSKEKSLIVARILWSNYQLPYSTKETIPTKFWVKENKKGERIKRVQETKSYLNHVEVNNALEALESNIKKVFNRFKADNDENDPTSIELKERLDVFLKRGKSVAATKKLPTFMEYLKDFIDRSKRGIRTHRKTGQALSKDTIKTYNTLLGHIEEYNKNLDWYEINLDFHADYTEYLIETYDLSSSSVGKDFSILKVV